ncbi:MAG: hypothetical protein NXI14_00820 [bacterium]|nr:hypothetical protein [bacterium]
MKTLITACAVLATAGAASASDLPVILVVDLSVPNQITVTATDAPSNATVSGSDSTGFYLESFFGADGTSGLNEGFVSGDLTSFLNGSDGSPNLFRGGTTDPGLNIWSYTNDPTSDFEVGVQAFSGSGTWSLDADDYANMLIGGERVGNVWFAADTLDDLGDAFVIGEYNVIIPTPGAAGLLGLAGLAAVRRRR